MRGLQNKLIPLVVSLLTQVSLSTLIIPSRGIATGAISRELLSASERFRIIPNTGPDTDPLSLGPLPLGKVELNEAQESLREAFLYLDQDCHLSNENRNLTVIDKSELRELASICVNRDKSIIYTPRKLALVACRKGQIDWTAKASIGSKGLGKRKEGDRKSPTGTYWLGYPRKSNLFGIYIPLGYPNKADMKQGYTGSAVGIHGPMRPFTCLPGKGLEKNWTAGCFAVARDQQILEISKWVLENWPVRLESLSN